MFFDDLALLPKIARTVSCSIFVVPAGTRPKLKNALYLKPAPGKSSITVDEMRDFLSLTASRETSDRFFIISPADKLNPEAENAFLKTLEEPNDFCHFVLLTDSPTSLLPTIRSRAQTFILKQPNTLLAPPAYPPKTIALAKQLISASPLDLPALATDISKLKPAPRSAALEIVSAAIELLYKSYFKTSDPRFLARLPNFLALHAALTGNGHIKLQILANLC